MKKLDSRSIEIPQTHGDRPFAFHLLVGPNLHCYLQMKVVNIYQCFLRLDMPDFQDIRIDDPRPACRLIIKDLIFPFGEEFTVVIQEIVNIGNVFNCQHLKIFEPVDADQEPVICRLVDEATVERVFIEDPGAVDDGAAVKIVVEMEDGFVADGISKAEAPDDIPELGEEVVGVVGPDHHFEIDGKEK